MMHSSIKVVYGTHVWVYEVKNNHLFSNLLKYDKVYMKTESEALSFQYILCKDWCHIFPWTLFAENVQLFWWMLLLNCVQIIDHVSLIKQLPQGYTYTCNCTLFARNKSALVFNEIDTGCWSWFSFFYSWGATHNWMFTKSKSFQITNFKVKLWFCETLS